jgi:hypothetical protein
MNLIGIDAGVLGILIPFTILIKEVALLIESTITFSQTNIYLQLTIFLILINFIRQRFINLADLTICGFTKNHSVGDKVASENIG